MFRLLVFLILAGAMGVSGYYRRRARIEGGTIPRAAEGTGWVLARIAFALPLFGSVFLYVAYPAWMRWSEFGVPEGARWSGVALGLLTVPAVFWVMRHIGPNVSETVLTKAEHQLVTSGPYRWIRHPLYTSGVVLFAGIGLAAANWFILALDVIILVVVRSVLIPREERELVQRFGTRYLDYAARTGAILPRVKPSE